MWPAPRTLVLVLVLGLVLGLAIVIVLDQTATKARSFWSKS
jgi:hypothetical protein